MVRSSSMPSMPGIRIVGEHDGRLRLPEDVKCLKNVFGGQYFIPRCQPDKCRGPLRIAFFVVGQQQFMVHGGFPVKRTR